MLWALHLAKVYANVHVMATTVSTPCKKTYWKWAWFFIEELGDLEGKVVSTSYFFYDCCQFLLLILLAVPFTVDPMGEQAHKWQWQHLFGFRQLCWLQIPTSQDSQSRPAGGDDAKQSTVHPQMEGIRSLAWNCSVSIVEWHCVD
jgi:hypothetical protein